MNSNFNGGNVIELNKEYVYKDICADLNWKESTGAQKKRQIKCIEESFEFYHPINKKTGKEKKSYVFTKMIKEPVLEDNRGGTREKAGRKADFPEEEFDYLWKKMVSEAYKRNSYVGRSWVNKVYFTNSLLFEMFGLSYGTCMHRVNFSEEDEVVKKIFQEIVYQALKSNTVTRLCKRYGFEKNSLPKGILRARSRFKLNELIDDDDLLEKYNNYLAEEIEKMGYKTEIETINNKKYFEACNNVQKRFETESKYNIQRMNMIKVEDIKVIENGAYFGEYHLIAEYRKHFREVIFESVEKSCINRIEGKKKYSKELNKEQKMLLMNYLNQFLGRDSVVEIETIEPENYGWLDLVC